MWKSVASLWKYIVHGPFVTSHIEYFPAGSALPPMVMSRDACSDVATFAPGVHTSSVGTIVGKTGPRPRICGLA